MKKRKVYEALAAKVTARRNAVTSGNRLWERRHSDAIDDILCSHLPHGSGLDGVTVIDYGRTKPDKLVIHSEYHAMDDNGMYDRWISFHLTIRPSLQFGITLTIVGDFGRYQDVKEYLHEVYASALETTI